jgi:hypothetical protein
VVDHPAGLGGHKSVGLIRELGGLLVNIAIGRPFSIFLLSWNCIEWTALGSV